MKFLYPTRIAIIFSVLVFIPNPTPAQVVGIVHDPINEIHLLAQVQHDLQMVQAAAANLQAYRTSWTSVSSRLVNMKQLLQSGASRGSISLTVANAQINQIQSELTAIKQLETLANGAQGSLQMGGAQARLQSELVSQLAEQRQLTLAQIEQDQLSKAQAVEYASSPAKYPGSP